MATAHYLHSTLYAFNDAARKEVIARFNAAVNDVSMQCTYSAEQDVFHLTCPTLAGSGPDEVLGNVISKYLDAELAAANDEDRKPNIIRFQESLALDFDLFAGDTMHPRAPSKLGTLPRASAALPVRHSCPQLNQAACLKLFKLQELPAGLLERVLSPDDPAMCKFIDQGATCRAAVWNPMKRDYVFNGRVGEPSGLVEDDYFDIVKFVPINDERDLSEAMEEVMPTQQSMTWKFVAGDEKTSVKQWLQGGGQTEVEAPDIQPEPPKDARRFMAQPEGHIHGMGRTRVPRVEVDSDSSADEDDESEVETPVNKGSFDAMLTGSKSRDKDNEQTSEMRTETKGSFGAMLSGNKSKANENNRPVSLPLKSDEGPTKQKSTFADMLQKPTTNIAQSPSKPVIEQPSASKVAQPSAPASVTPRSPSAASQRSFGADHVPSTPSQDQSWPTYERSYASVDKLGLTGIAANQATWEHENRDALRPKSKRSGIVRRPKSSVSGELSPQPTNGSSASMSLSTGPELRKFSVPSPPPSLRSSGTGSGTIRSHANSHISNQSWVSIVVKPIPSGEQLIDDSTPMSSVSSRPAPRSASSQTQPGGHRVRPQYLQCLEPATQPLIDFSEDEAANERSQKERSLMSIGNQARPSLRMSSGKSNTEDEDEIVERLRPVDQPVIKHSTMRQKAGKKNKKQNKTTAPKVQLPKPEPVPPPKKTAPARKERSAGSVRTDISQASTLVADEPSAPAQSSTETRLQSDNPDKLQEPKAAECCPNTSVGKLVKYLGLNSDGDDVSVDLQFGMVLLRHFTDKSFRDGKVSAKELQSKLENAGSALQHDFLPRMTTSAADARYMLDMMPSNQLPSVEIEYQILVKDSEGRQRTLKFNQIPAEATPDGKVHAKDNLIVESANVLGTLYLHYPVHIWDARVTINRPDVDETMMEAAQEFVASMQTTGEPPSFAAMVPLNAFNVDKVHVLRKFSRTDTDGIELRVSEVQDLILEPLNDGRYNLKAIAASREEMVDSQRIWWECGLHTSNVEVKNVDRLENLAEDVVSRVDGVGFANKGPWVHNEAEEPEERVNTTVSTDEHGNRW